MTQNTNESVLVDIDKEISLAFNNFDQINTEDQEKLVRIILFDKISLANRPLHILVDILKCFIVHFDIITKQIDRKIITYFIHNNITKETISLLNKFSNESFNINLYNMFYKDYITEKILILASLSEKLTNSIVDRLIDDNKFYQLISFARNNPLTDKRKIFLYVTKLDRKNEWDNFYTKILFESFPEIKRFSCLI